MSPERCPACGRVAFVDVGELYYDLREIEIIACCEANREGWLEEMDTWSRAQLVSWVGRKAGFKIRNILTRENPRWLLDYNVEIHDIANDAAKAFIELHHEHNNPPRIVRFCGGIYNGSELIGVVAVGNPNSRHLYAQGCMGIDRVCINRDLPRGLVSNACSLAYGWACREIARRLPAFSRVVTYTLLDEPGTSLVAAGFIRTFKTKGGSWNRKNRPRTDKATTERKWRWERNIGTHLPRPDRKVFALPSGRVLLGRQLSDHQLGAPVRSDDDRRDVRDLSESRPSQGDQQPVVPSRPSMPFVDSAR